MSGSPSNGPNRGIRHSLWHNRRLSGILPRRQLDSKGERFVKKYKCEACDYVYDPAKGDPDHGVPAGTAFEAIPDDWTCPDCGVGKDAFSPVE